MPRSARKATGRAAGRGNGRGRRKATPQGNGRSARGDAIALLKADHREVEGLFSQFEKARSDDKKLELAQKICMALTAHTTIEEEIFYPAFLEATDETEIHHEAEVEHAGAKNLIAKIEGSRSGDGYLEAKVTVLSEMIKHHVNEEEKRGGMFAKARQSDMDLQELGAQLQKRKQQVMGESRGRQRTGRVPRGAMVDQGSRAQREAARRA